MSEQNFKQYLGWGLVGTPAGRQYTSDGIDKQFNLGKTAFELAQDLGGCLPSPKEGSDIPLYALISRSESNNFILGFAEYFSIYEQGQSRAGTYFGSFIETVNALFTSNSLKEVFSGLRQLSIYQTQHFIDQEKSAYHTGISGRSFETPSVLDKIQLQGLPQSFVTKTSPADFLFIHCQQGEAILVAEKLLTTGLYYQYKDIFFSESELISAQIRQMKRLQISSAQLFNLDDFISPYKSEISYLHAYIQELSQKYNNATGEINRLNTEQTKIIQQEVAKNVEIQVQAYQQERDNAILEMQKIEAKAKLGDTQLSHFSGEVSQEVIARIKPGLDALDACSKRLNLLLQSKAQYQPNEAYENNANSSNNALVWIITSASLFLILLIGILWLFFATPEETAADFKKTPEYKSLITKSDELSKSTKALSQKDTEIQKLNQRIKDLCSSLDSKKQRDQGCNNEKAQ